MPAVNFKNVDIVFGDNPKVALPYAEQGLSREDILAKTGQVLGVCNATLDVKQGEICVLMGLSGSGKSTLLRAVNGLNKVIRGKVEIKHEGKIIDVANCDSNTLRELRMHKIAMVFQQFALLPWRTVRENVGLGLEIQGIAKAERDKKVTEKLEMVGLEQWGNKYGHELSGGMQQRVGLARAFVTDGDILLMDEPFSALDPLIRERLQDELLELQASLNKTIIFVSHDLDEALKIGSRIAIMENGRVVQYAEPEDIVLNPANEYVADFVAHMNPLNVLRGHTLMRTFNSASNATIKLDKKYDLTLALDDGKPISANEAGTNLKLVAAHSILDHPNDSYSNAIALAPTQQRMKDIIKLRHITKQPVVMVDEESFAGIIGDDEIYQGILRQSEITPTSKPT